jgi:hypothetical protein
MWQWTVLEREQAVCKVKKFLDARMDAAFLVFIL